MDLRSTAKNASPTLLLRLSIVVAIVTIVMKTAAWWITDSVGLLSDAMESLVNLASAAFALTMVTIARRPADADHPYGHHKAEYFSSGFEGLAIIVAAVGIAWAAVQRLFHPQPLGLLGWGLALSVSSSALNGVLAWAMLQSGRKHRSMALEGDARHLITDVWTSAGVVLGVGLVALTGWAWLDPAVAVGVALNILREGAHLMWKSSQGLMDEALEPEVMEEVGKTLAAFEHPAIRFDHLSSRRSGKRRFIDLHMHMPSDWTLRRAAAVRASVEQALMSAVPGLRATIQLLPNDVEVHSQDEDDLI
ncbi:cation diffusion facilitator family transporter [Caenimonas terrae]|uniref:Cation diffusion facilitator family transporter n=1 Tax=Caenimonas terrae TaxID=696074 RepID=A0ABW0NIE1_9BURK